MVRGAQAHTRRAAFYSHTDAGRARWHTERARSLMTCTSFGTWMGTTEDGADALADYQDLVLSGGLTDDNIRMVLEELRGSIYSGAFTISNWNIGNVRDMSGLFEGWVDFNEQLNWHTPLVERFDAMFKGCTRLGQSRSRTAVLADPRAFTVKLNFRSAVSVRDMFAGCTNVHLIAEDAPAAVQEELNATLGTRDGGRGNRVTWSRNPREYALELRGAPVAGHIDSVASGANWRMEARLRTRRDRAAIAYEARLAAQAERDRAAVAHEARLAAAAVAQAERQRRVLTDVAGVQPTCNVCFHNQARYVPPCGHALCGACTNGVLDLNALCHICRAPVTSDGYRQALFFGI